MAILLFIAILVGLIVVHEFGHFAVAKLFGIRVDEFGVFFPPRLLAWKRGETEYSFNAVPLGGFVRIHGQGTDEAEAADPRSFTRKSRWVRAAVMVAGVVMNAALAWLLVSTGYMVGLPTAADHEGVGTVTNTHAMIVGILPDSPAEAAGLVAGDTVEVVQSGTALLDTRTLNTSEQSDVVRNFIAAHADESLIFTVIRDGGEKSFLAKAAAGLTPDRKVVGIELNDVGTLRLPLHLALYQGLILSKNIFVQTAAGLGSFALQLVRGHADFSQVSGPIGIVSMGGIAIKEGPAAVIVLVASISMALAIFNLLPIPGLDGGQIVILALEGALRRPVSPRIVAGLTMLGIALLVTLVVVVSYHDVAKLLG